jgi:signal transduction histidine kinase
VLEPKVDGGGSEGREAQLIEIGLAIGREVEIDALLEVVMRHVTQLLRAERSTLYLVDPQRGELWSKVLQGGGLREIRLPLGRGIAGAVVADRKLANVPDAYQDPRFLPDFDQASGYRTRSILCAPVLDRRGSVVAAVQVLNRLDGQPFDGGDAAALSAVSAQVSVALENTRLLEVERRKLRELDLLYALEGEVAAVREVGALAGLLLSRARDVTAAQAAALHLPAEQEGADLFFLGARDEEPAHAHLPDPVPPLPPQTRRLQRAQADSFVARHSCERFGYGPRTGCSAPLVCEGRVLGLLELYDHRGQGFDDEDEKLLSLLGGLAGRALERLRHQQARERDERLRLLGQTLASLMHDLRAPLTLVLGNAELMAIENNAGERAGQAATILRSVGGMVQMMDEVLAHLRGDTTLALSRLEAGQLFAEVASTVRHDLSLRGIELRLETAGAPAFRGDRGKLVRALLNLCRNAIEAMPAGGVLQLSARSGGEGAVLAVRDSGRGIPEEIRAKVFEPFFTHGKQGGTGLGLSFVRQAAEAHGGQVRLSSAPGAGTTFELVLPQ